ncbi:helix-turn-helix domain-containing protein [Microbacterium terrisoli]|uniref:helix-turn-helix domain-containing protein n=1 Tax=Microbacterium terrisoli TaxID=3242192 RepID=UPI002804D894|nr:helix-turn-helix transcriptional regulator [Microbacterium protaetiae]
METDVDDYTRAIAAILKDAQTRHGQPTYDELAEMTGLGRATVSRILTGKRDITMRYLRLMCLALGLDPAQVLTDAESNL